MGDEGFLDAVVERWRAAGVCGQLDNAVQAQMFAEAVSFPASASLPRRAEVPLERPAVEKPDVERTTLADRIGADRVPDGYEIERRRSPLLPDGPRPSGGLLSEDPPPLRRHGASDIPRAAPYNQRATDQPTFAPRNEPQPFPPQPAPQSYAPPPAPQSYTPQPTPQPAEAGPSNSRLALRERLLKPLAPR